MWLHDGNKNEDPKMQQVRSLHGGISMKPKLKEKCGFLEKELIVRLKDLEFLIKKINELQDEIEELKKK